jgi:hypothetical protein
MKQCCLTKQCIAPILPSTASCQVCSKKKGSRKLSQLKADEILYECERCMEIHHLPCFHVCIRCICFSRRYCCCCSYVEFICCFLLLIVFFSIDFHRRFILTCQRTKVSLVMTYLKHGYVRNVSMRTRLNHHYTNYDPLFDVH